MKKPFSPEVYLVTDKELSRGRPVTEIVEKAARGGVDVVQLREKGLATRDFIELALEVQKILKPFRVPLLINDRIDVTLAINADGVHIGQSDMPYELARKLLGPDAIIGLSAESIAQAEQANAYDLDYIAISPVFRTPTKEELQNELGLEGVRQITGICKHPAIGIGSIKTTNAASIIEAGADGVAVVSGICSADDPEEATRQYKTIVREAKQKIRHT